jgi:hypothetical protein
MIDGALPGMFDEVLRPAGKLSEPAVELAICAAI